MVLVTGEEMSTIEWALFPKIDLLFDPLERECAKGLIHNLLDDGAFRRTHHLSTDDLARIIQAAIRFSHGSIEALCEALELAADDWPELLAAARPARSIS